MRIDLHNHTTRCNHAEGTPGEFVEQAIKQKIDIFGFSCHAPMKFDPEFRMGLEERHEYERDILQTKEQFQGECNVLLGYEVDWLEGYMEDEIIHNKNADYLIGSVHFLNGWGVDNPESIFQYIRQGIDDVWFGYFDALEKMAQSGLFDIVGHMDLVKIFNYYPSKDIRGAVEKVLKAVKKSNMAIEVNASGLRKPIKEQYPSRGILEMMYGMDIPITFGSDAHHVDHIGFEREYIENLCKEVGYTKSAGYQKRDRELFEF